MAATAIEARQGLKSAVTLRALILGANGLVGHELQKQLHCGASPQGLPWTRERLDIRSAEEVHETLHRHRPDIVINAVVAWPEGNQPDDTLWQVNAVGAANIARSCATLGIPLLHLSDAKIFGGLHERVSHRESDTPRPTSGYTQSKLAAEHAVLRAADSAMSMAWKTGFKYWIVRTASLFSTEVCTDLATTAKRISSLREVVASPEVSLQPTDVSQLVSHLVWLLRNKNMVPSGIYHIASAQVTTEQQLLVRLAALLGSGPEQIKSVSYEEKCRRRNVASGLLPRWSALDCGRWQKICPLPLPSWELPLQSLLKRLPEVSAVS